MRVDEYICDVCQNHYKNSPVGCEPAGSSLSDHHFCLKERKEGNCSGEQYLCEVAISFLDARMYRPDLCYRCRQSIKNAVGQTILTIRQLDQDA